MSLFISTCLWLFLQTLDLMMAVLFKFQISFATLPRPFENYISNDHWKAWILFGHLLKLFGSTGRKLGLFTWSFCSLPRYTWSATYWISLQFQRPHASPTAPACLQFVPSECTPAIPTTLSSIPSLHRPLSWISPSVLIYKTRVRHGTGGSAVPYS